jgi:hypothetical protein
MAQGASLEGMVVDVDHREKRKSFAKERERRLWWLFCHRRGDGLEEKVELWFLTVVLRW